MTPWRAKELRSSLLSGWVGSRQGIVDRVIWTVPRSASAMLGFLARLCRVPSHQNAVVLRQAHRQAHRLRNVQLRVSVAAVGPMLVPAVVQMIVASAGADAAVSTPPATNVNGTPLAPMRL